jgi:hypothetical protein
MRIPRAVDHSAPEAAVSHRHVETMGPSAPPSGLGEVQVTSSTVRQGDVESQPTSGFKGSVEDLGWGACEALCSAACHGMPPVFGRGDNTCRNPSLTLLTSPYLGSACGNVTRGKARTARTSDPQRHNSGGVKGAQGPMISPVRWVSTLLTSPPERTQDEYELRWPHARSRARRSWPHTGHRRLL